MHGTRARIGYTSPPLVSEIFPYEFYRLAPDGVTLAVTTLDVWEHTGDELDSSFTRTTRAAHAMAEAGVDLIVLGGVPVLSSKGVEQVGGFAKAMEDECGVPVTTAPEAYRTAFKRLGAQKVVAVEAPHSPGNDTLERAGIAVLEKDGFRETRMVVSTRQPSEEVAELGRRLVRKHPDADSLWLSWPHRAAVDQIEPLERELGVNVVSATQAIVWHALRRCGIDDAIPGFGRLMRET